MITALLERLTQKEDMATRSGGIIVRMCALSCHSKHAKYYGTVLRGIYWYCVPHQKLLWSTTATAHIENGFTSLDPDLFRIFQKDDYTKLDAYRAGWISGRVGENGGRVFAYVYRAFFERLGLRHPGFVGADLIRKLEATSGFEIGYFLDEDGHDLIGSEGENKLGSKRQTVPDGTLIVSETKIITDVIADAHSEERRYAVWWFNLKEGKFEFSIDAWGHRDEKEFSHKEDDSEWVRGRVFQSSGDNLYYIVIYKFSFKQEVLSESISKQILGLITSRLPESMAISGVIDDEGRKLLGG